MTDIFFSYRSVDRERVRPIHDAFAKQGFDVFWDQEVPSGVDWDTWIRQHLAKSKCAVVFWSVASVQSDNVRHEATVAKRQGKLIVVLLEPLTPDQFPMGLYSQQAINLADWKGDFDHAEWRKLNHDIEAKLTPPWMQRRVFELEAELVAERARREGVENRDRVLQAQIAKEVLAQDDLRRERNKALDEAVTLKARVDDLSRVRSDMEGRATELSQRLSAAEAERAIPANPGLVGKSVEPKRSFSAKNAGVLSIAIAAAFAIGYGAHSLTSPKSSTASTSPQADRASPTIQAPTASVSPQAPVATTLRAPTEPALPQAPTASPVTPVQQPSPTGASDGFAIRRNARATGGFDSSSFDVSFDECAQSCRKASTCAVFTFSKGNRACYLYSRAEFQDSHHFDSGVRR